MWSVNSRIASACTSKPLVPYPPKPPAPEVTVVHDPDKALFGVTPMQTRVLLSAERRWKSAADMNGNVGIQPAQRHLFDALVRAGFLQETRDGNRQRYYCITPAGSEFRTYLERLEAARE